MRLTWTFKSLRQVKYSCDTSSFTLSRGLVPPFWSLVLKLIAVTSAVYVWTLRLTCVFSWSHTTSKLCRWLAGVFRESLHPYFIRSSVLTYKASPISCVISYSLPILYHNWSGKSSVYVSFFILFITFYLGPMIHLVISYWPTPYYITLFLFVKRGSRGGACGVGCTELTMYLFHSLY